MSEEIMKAIIEFYTLEDEFLEEAVLFLMEYDAYMGEQEYNLQYLKKLIVEKILRGVPNE